MMVWECAIPGKAGSIWEGGLYKLFLTFPPSYPAQGPACVFSPPLPHINVFASGAVCLSIISYGWKPAITLKQILVGIQTLLDEPNPNSVANHSVYETYRKNVQEYEKQAKAFARKNKPEN